MMQPVVVVDGMIMAYRVNSSVGHLKNSRGVLTGLKFGVLRCLMSYEKKFNAREVVIAWDLKGPIKKAEGTAEYKANRTYDEKTKTMFGQLEELRNLIGMTKYTQIYKEGYEADDMIAAYVRFVPPPAVIITSDTDLQQLVGEGVTIWTGGKTNKTITRDTVRAEWGVEPYQMSLLRAALGDKSDNLAPLIATKSDQTRFLEFLEKNPTFVTTDQVREWDVSNYLAPTDGTARVAGEFWDAMKKRERLMRLLYPDDELGSCIFSGQRDKKFLTKEFAEMESKTLSGSIHKLV